MLKITGIDIPTPSSYAVGIQDINKAERNANGTMIIERIRTGVRKIELSWRYLSKDDTSKVLNVVSGTVFQVEYEDPQSGVRETRTFYAGDRSIGALDYIDGEIRWKDIKFNVVER